MESRGRRWFGMIVMLAGFLIMLPIFVDVLDHIYLKADWFQMIGHFEHQGFWAYSFLFVPRGEVGNYFAASALGGAILFVAGFLTMRWARNEGRSGD